MTVRSHLFMAAALSFTSSLMAHGHSVPPSHCPSVETIQSLRIVPTDMIEINKSSTWHDANGFPHTMEGLWATREIILEQSDKGQWSFSLFRINGFTANDAAKKAGDTLSGLILESEELHKERFRANTYYCYYLTNNILKGTATYVGNN